MKKSTIFIYIVSAVLIIIAYFVGGKAMIAEGFDMSLQTGIKSLPMLITSFLLIGQINVLLTTEVLKKWLEKFKGIKAIIVASIAGGIFPGGPYVYYPFVLSLREKELPFYIMISFIYGKQVYDLPRLPMEISLIDPKVAIIRNLITLPFPIIVGVIAHKFFEDKGSFVLKNKGSDNS